jgi:hypothetical protein
VLCRAEPLSRKLSQGKLPTGGANLERYLDRQLKAVCPPKRFGSNSFDPWEDAGMATTLEAAAMARHDAPPASLGSRRPRHRLRRYRHQPSVCVQTAVTVLVRAAFHKTVELAGRLLSPDNGSSAASSPRSSSFRPPSTASSRPRLPRCLPLRQCGTTAAGRRVWWTHRDLGSTEARILHCDDRTSIPGP